MRELEARGVSRASLSDLSDSPSASHYGRSKADNRPQLLTWQPDRRRFNPPSIRVARKGPAFSALRYGAFIRDDDHLRAIASHRGLSRGVIRTRYT